jgi:hypothetical protein
MEPVPPQNFPRVRGTPVQTLPIQSEGPTPFYPPVCIKSHWDPTAILRHTLPEGRIPLPTDPRPWVRICMEYTTTGTNEPAPEVPAGAVLPSGGQFYPPTKYQEAINNESLLRRLDRPLGTCEDSQYLPAIDGDMFSAKGLVPARNRPDSRFISELEFPKVLLQTGPYECRAEQDRINLSRSTLLFNNATKQERYKQSFPTKKLKTPLPSSI